MLPIPAARGLEDQLSDFLQAPVLPVLGSGTASLIVALMHLRTKNHRRKVVIPGYTCPLVPIAIAQCGLIPVVCDTERNSFDLSPESLARCMDDDVLAVIPTHIGGLPAALQPALDLARKAGAFVVEDAAQALGAKIDGRAVGTIGDIGFFSLSIGKGLSIYHGGFLTCRDPEMISGLKSVTDQLVRGKWWRECFRVLQLAGFSALYNPLGTYFAYGLPLRRLLMRGDLEQAAGDRFPLVETVDVVGSYRRNVGARAAQRLRPFIEDNRKRGRQRASWLSDIAGIKVLGEPSGAEGSFPFLTVVFDDPAACRRALATLWPSGLGVAQLFTRAVSDYAYLKPILQNEYATPHATRLAERSLTISNSQWLCDADFHSIRVAIAEASGQMRRLKAHALRA
jgi:dTDP-4-amino-4,6-dideoxygalactose transaminase